MALVVLVYGVRNAVRRAREYYADAWAGASAAQRRRLSETLARMPRSRSRAAASVLGVHPDPGLRRRILADSTGLFRPRVTDAPAAGVLAGFAYPTMKSFLFRRVRDLALDKARQLGLDEEKAALLANATVGSLAVSTR